MKCGINLEYYSSYSGHTLDASCVGLVAANIMNEVNVCRLPMHVDDYCSLPCQLTMWIEIYMFKHVYFNFRQCEATTFNK